MDSKHKEVNRILKCPGDKFRKILNVSESANEEEIKSVIKANI